MIDPIVRRGDTDDAVTVGDLETAARQSLIDARGGSRWLDEHPAMGDRWRSALADGTVFVAVIPLDDRSVVDDGPVEVLVGYLAVHLVDGLMRQGDESGDAARLVVAHVEQVFVLDDARELGFGDALPAAAMDWGRAQGATLVEAHALPGDRQLKNLYERAGVTARLITVSRKL
ncbi:hypothetical protein BH24ACT5_BH24ACT5_03870 [soil metagenome]